MAYVIGRRGNAFIGQDISAVIGGANRELEIIYDIEKAVDCDVFIDCTNAETFMNNSFAKYRSMGKAVVIGTTAFSEADQKELSYLAQEIPVFLTGNFSVALHDFIETLKFAAKRISKDTDVQIVEYHHNQKKDAPSGTALMIKKALLEANISLQKKTIDILSVRGGNIFGEHEVIFANCKDEIVTFKHVVSSRETFADGAVEVAKWIAGKDSGLYNMDNFCEELGT